MRKFVFSVFDSKAEFFMQPFFAVTQAVAIREFSTICRDGTHLFGLHPEDFTLFELGVFDEKTAAFEMYSTPKSILLGSVARGTGGA